MGRSWRDLVEEVFMKVEVESACQRALEKFAVGGETEGCVMGSSERIEAYVEERDEVLRSLDVGRFEAFWRKHRQPMPRSGRWASPVVPLIMMHKARLAVTTMIEAEKAVSREWLAARGYSEDFGGVCDGDGGNGTA